MSKVVQHFGRISGIRKYVIAATLLSALVLVPAVVVAQAPSTHHFEVLHAFNGRDGELALSGVILDTAGNVYGATSSGGDLNCSDGDGWGCGVVFELSTTGKEKVLHKFKGQDGWYALGGELLSGTPKETYTGQPILVATVLVRRLGAELSSK